MNHLLIFIVFVVGDIVKGDVTSFILSHTRDGPFYRIGERVNLTCTVDRRLDLSVLFKRNGKNMGENGVSYQREEYPMKKREYSKEGPIEYELEIRTVKWIDRGKWECVQGEKGMTVTVNITVPGIVRPLQSSLDQSSTDNTLQRTPQADLTRLLYGKGVRNNPFDLTRGDRVRLRCESGCSYPKGTHDWTFRNLTVSGRRITPTDATSSTCNITSSADGFLTMSTVVIDCAELQMVGSNEIECKMSGTNESRSVHVLCPGGHRPWELTNGEIVGLSIAVGLAALMLVLFVMSAKKIVNSYRYGSVMGGIRV